MGLETMLFYCERYDDPLDIWADDAGPDGSDL